MRLPFPVTPVPRGAVPRGLAAVGTALALSACTVPPSTGVGFVDRAGTPQVLRVEVDPADRVRVLREAALRTPIQVDPEATGAPPAQSFGPNVTVSEAELIAAGVDIGPDMRVWVVRPVDQTVQVFGPPPGVRAD